MSAAIPPGGAYGPFTGFPPTEAYGRAFFDEAIRHLEDALVLHRATRWAAAVTSSMKCAELAIKSGLLLEGALGWWSKLEQTHAPFNAIRQHVVLKDHAAALEAYNPALKAGLEVMERLVSNRSGEAFSFDNLVNTEYPFYFVGEHPQTRIQGKYLLRPGTHFGEPDSRLAYATARDVLLAYQAINPMVAGWSHTVPDAL